MSTLWTFGLYIVDARPWHIAARKLELKEGRWQRTSVLHMISADPVEPTVLMMDPAREAYDIFAMSDAPSHAENAQIEIFADGRLANQPRWGEDDRMLHIRPHRLNRSTQRWVEMAGLQLGWAATTLPLHPELYYKVHAVPCPAPPPGYQAPGE